MQKVTCKLYGDGIISGSTGIKLHVFFSSQGDYKTFTKAGQLTDHGRVKRTLSQDDSDEGFWEGGERVNIAFHNPATTSLNNVEVMSQKGDTLFVDVGRDGIVLEMPVNLLECTISNVDVEHFNLAYNQIVYLDGQAYIFQKQDDDGDEFHSFETGQYVKIQPKDVKELVATQHIYQWLNGSVVEIEEHNGVFHYGRVENEHDTSIVLSHNTKEDRDMTTIGRDQIRRIRVMCYEDY